MKAHFELLRTQMLFIYATEALRNVDELDEEAPKIREGTKTNPIIAAEKFFFFGVDELSFGK